MDVKELLSLHSQLVDLVSRVEAVLEGFEIPQPEQESPFRPSVVGDLEEFTTPPTDEEVAEIFEPTHVTAEGQTLRLRDMTNIHLLRCVGKQLEYNHRERTREYIHEILTRGWEGTITEQDARRLGFCTQGIRWAKEEFSLQSNEISVRRLLRFLELTHKEEHRYESHIICILRDFVYNANIAGHSRATLNLVA